MYYTFVALLVCFIDFLFAFQILLFVHTDWYARWRSYKVVIIITKLPFHCYQYQEILLFLFHLLFSLFLTIFCFVHRYCHYLRSVCAAEGDAIYKQLLKSMGHTYNPLQPSSSSSSAASDDGQQQAITCVDAFTRLFEFVASVIEAEAAVVDAKFGAQWPTTATTTYNSNNSSSSSSSNNSISSIYLIRSLQAQTDVHATKILDLFLEHFKIQKMVCSVRSCTPYYEIILLLLLLLYFYFFYLTLVLNEY